MKATPKDGDFAGFKDFMQRLVAVPHAEIKAKLEAEKASKRSIKSVSRRPKP